MGDPFSVSERNELLDVLRRHCSPLEPHATGASPRLTPLDGIRAVLFDVYGTLLISGSGDVGTTNIAAQPAAFAEALSAIGIRHSGDPGEGVDLLMHTIAAQHARERAAGFEHPEVDIRRIWRDVLEQLQNDAAIDLPEPTTNTTRLALEYEVRTNPVWAMPSAVETLAALRNHRLTLGIVSNAQVFTRLLFPIVLGHALDELGFEEDLCLWSYEYRQAKPGTFLYERAAERLAERGIAAREVLFVGNDMLKDIWPASRVRFRTALFAGDRRSYRPREGDERVGLTPDLVLTDLSQLPECVRRDS